MLFQVNKEKRAAFHVYVHFNTFIKGDMSEIRNSVEAEFIG